MNVESLLSMPTLHLKLTISFVGIPIVSLNVSLISEETSLEKVMGPFGSLMEQVIRPGSERNE
jgi:hypothetical protein